jgi:hypothetical protein
MSDDKKRRDRAPAAKRKRESRARLKAADPKGTAERAAKSKKAWRDRQKDVDPIGHAKRQEADKRRKQAERDAKKMESPVRKQVSG